MQKVSLKKSVVEMPHDLTEAADFLRRIGERERKIETIANRLNDRIGKLKAYAQIEVEALGEESAKLLDGLFAYAESHRPELTNGDKKKTVNLPTGDILWRLTPPKVNIQDEEQVIAGLKALNLRQFIRTKEEVNKEAMLEEPTLAQTVKGVSITQKEHFVVKPTDVKGEIVSPKAKKIKVLQPVAA